MPAPELLLTSVRAGAGLNMHKHLQYPGLEDVYQTRKPCPLPKTPAQVQHQHHIIYLSILILNCLIPQCFTADYSLYKQMQIKTKSINL